MINLWIVKERLKTSAAFARHNGAKTILGAHLNIFLPYAGLTLIYPALIRFLLLHSQLVPLYEFSHCGSKKLYCHFL